MNIYVKCFVCVCVKTISVCRKCQHYFRNSIWLLFCWFITWAIRFEHVYSTIFIYLPRRLCLSSYMHKCLLSIVQMWIYGGGFIITYRIFFVPLDLVIGVFGGFNFYIIFISHWILKSFYWLHFCTVNSMHTNIYSFFFFEDSKWVWF